MAKQQLDIFDAIAQREAAEDQAAEEESVLVTPAVAAIYCIRCREPITPQGWCPCKIRKELR